MSTRPFLRDLTLLAAAAVIGWWAHGNTTVYAEPDANLAFQYGGLGPSGEITLYNPGTKTLYVYPSVGRSGNGHINCLYGVRVDRAGAPIERENCAAGSFLPR